MKTVILALLGYLSMTLSAQIHAASSPVIDFLSDDKLRPGLCVFLGCNDPQTVVQAQHNGRYLVHAIDPDVQKVEQTRTAINKAQIYGSVATDQAQYKRLPYADNIINILIIENYAYVKKHQFNPNEIERVVAPYGSVFISKPPTSLKISSQFKSKKLTNGWIQLTKSYPEAMDEWPQKGHDAARTMTSNDTLVGPPTAMRWIAGNAWTDEVSWSYMKMVSAGGRVFYKYNIKNSYGRNLTEEKILILARDAFNGLEIWRKYIPYDKSFKMDLPMVATKTKLYIPGVVLDATTGKEIGKSKGARALHKNGVYLLANGKPKLYDAETNELLWEYKKGCREGLIGEEHIYARLYDGSLVCLERETGKELWQAPGQGEIFSYRDGIIFTRQYKTKGDGLNHAYDAKDGKHLWTHAYPLPAHGGRPDIWFLHGLAWVHDADPKRKKYVGESWVGLNPRTGVKEKRVLMEYKVKHRCAPHRATVNYIMGGGMDFFDLKQQKVFSFHGVRNVCSFGYMPANGMIYSSTTLCMCFAQIRGASGVARDHIPSVKEMRARSAPDFIKGTAFLKKPSLKISEFDWPSYRNGPQRFGSTTHELPEQLKQAWISDLGAKISSPVAAAGLVVVSLVDQHQVVALNDDNGKERWRFQAGARVDSPPTLYQGRTYFGCRDGWLYCLSADNGELVWRRRIAPEDKRIVSRGQIESAWAVPGSVLIQDDTLYCAAGRHSEIDGGIFLCAINPKNGNVIWEQQVQRPNAFEQTAPSKIDNEANEILSSDGKTLYMHLHQFDCKTGERSSVTSNYMWGSPVGFTVDITNPPYGWKHEEQRQWKYKDTRGRHIAKGTSLSVQGNHVYGIYNDRGEIFRNRNKQAWRVKAAEGSRARAILVAGNTFYIASVNLNDNKTGQLYRLNCEDGTEKYQSVTLPVDPRHDGMAATKDKLVICSKDGKVVCLK